MKSERAPVRREASWKPALRRFSITLCALLTGALKLIGEAVNAQLPVITQQPVSQVVTSGAIVTFSVAAVGTPPLTYQWRFNGEELYRRTNTTLVLPNVNLAYVGRYSVRVGNSVGSALSDDATLTVIPPTPAPGSHVIVGWGQNYWGQLNVPAELTNPVAVAAGQYHSMALRADGTVVLWGGGGADYETAREVPPGLGNVAAISANWGTSFALRSDGTAVPWGVGISDPYPGPPESLENIAGISAGGFFALALRGDGRIIAWGFDDSGQNNVPQGLANVVAVAGGSHHALALKGDGTVVGWGYNGTGQASVPAGLSNVVAISPGSSASLALKADGTVVAWGSLAEGPASPPTGLTDVVALACGASHAVALRQNGSVIGWGDSRFALAPAPLSNVVAVATTSSHTLALLGDGSPHVTVHPWNRSVRDGAAVSFTAKAVGTSPLHYQWQRNGTDILNETNATLTIAAAHGGNAGVYRALVRNAHGLATARPAVLTVEGAQTGGPGVVDPSFHAALGGEVSAMAQQPDGRVLVAGYFVEGTGSRSYDVVRFNADGTADGTFQVSLEGTWGVNALALQPDGKVILGGGFDHINGIARPGLARVNTDGTLDTSYHPPNPSAPNQTIVFAMSLQPDGKVVVGGWSYGAFHGWVARFHADGTLDGMFVNHIGNAVYDVAIQLDGKTLVAGDFTGVDGGERSNLFRLNPDGSIDAGFNPDVPRVFAMELQPDGRILLGGDRLIRLHSDGSRDASFGASLPAGWIQALAVQPNGQVLVGSGGAWDDEEGVVRYCLVRVNPDGSGDESFENNTLWAGGDTPITALVLHRDGSIWVGGQFRTVNDLPRFGLVRLYGDSPSVAEPFVRRRISQLHVELAAEPKTNTSAYAVEDQPPAGWLASEISHGGIFDPATGKVKFGPFFDPQSRSLSYAVTPPASAQGVFLVSGVASADGANTPVVGDDRFVISGAHPADAPPADWLMAIAEVTAYGAAWRTGGTWVLPPNPIPIDYVTRAAALWRGGECYEVSSTASAMPLGWVNCGADNGAELAPAFSLDGVTRQLPPNFIPGESLVVTVACAPPSGTAACAIEDQPPAGWQIDSVSAGGDWDAVNGRVKWGPFLDATPRRLTYHITPPRTATGSVAFNGSASFDGIGAPINGPSTLSEACRLQVNSSFPGQFELTLTGRNGVRLLIEASSDLRTWTTVGEMTTGPTPLPFVDSTADQFSQRFYRAREE